MTPERKLQNICDGLGAMITRYEAIHPQLRGMRIRNLDPETAYYLGVAQALSRDILEDLGVLLDASHRLHEHAQRAAAQAAQEAIEKAA